MAPSIVKRYAIAFDQYKIAGFVAFALCVSGAGLMSLSEPPPPVYRAKGVMSASAPPVPLSTTGPTLHEEGKAALTAEFLLDEMVAKVVAEKVGVDPEKVKSAKVTVPKPEEPQFYFVEFQDDTPERATAVVETLMKTMVDKSREVNQSRLKSLIEEMQKRMPDVQGNLEKAEENLLQFDRIQGAIFLEAETGKLQASVVAAQDKQEQAQQQLKMINGQIADLEQRLGLTIDEAYTSSALSRDPIISSLRGQIAQIESQQALKAQTLRPDHPEMIELRRQVGGLERLLEQRAAEIIGGGGTSMPLPGSSRIRISSALDPLRQDMAAQLVTLQLQRTNTIREIESAQQLQQNSMQRFVSLPDLQLERERLAREVAIKKGFFDQLQAQLLDAQTARDETQSNLTIAQPPVVEESITPPPNVLILILAGAVGGIGIGGALIFLLSALEGRCYTMEEVAQAFESRDLKVLGTIPQIITLEELAPSLIPTIADPESPYLEYYERLRSNLLRVGEANKVLKVIAITSTGADEGKTTSAYNLAIASARAGKRTLLIEADVRSSSKSESLRISVDPHSLAEPLQHYDPMHNNIRLVPGVENLYMIPTPGPQRDAVAILESSEFRALLATARARFDFIVVDTPSLSRCNDTLLVEPLTDGLVMVGRPGFTQTAMVAEQAAMFEAAEGRLTVLGTIVNGAELVIELPSLDEDEDEFDEFRSDAIEQRSQQAAYQHGYLEDLEVPNIRR